MPPAIGVAWEVWARGGEHRKSAPELPVYPKGSRKTTWVARVGGRMLPGQQQRHQ